MRILFHRITNRGRYVNDFESILENSWRALNDDLATMLVENINDQSVINELDRIKPDLVLVHGTTLIKEKVLRHVPLALNLHWGLSPYYRGSYCTEWALINADPHNIGFTIHKITPQIDGGEILTQARVRIEAEDTANRINMKLTKDGTEEMINVVTRLKYGEEPQFSFQELDKGFLYLTRHWNWSFQRLIRSLEKKEGIKKMLNKSTRKPQEIKTWQKL